MTRLHELSLRWVNAVDVALWDLAGKIAGQPIYQLLGPYRHKVLACATSAYYPEVRPYAEEATECRRRGFRAYMMHGGGRSPRGMIRLCEEVRKAVGDDMQLMLDTGSDPASLPDALEIGRALEALRYRWYGDPMAWWQVENLAELARRLNIPIAVHDIAEPRLFPHLAYIKGNAGIIIRDDAARDGITGVKKLAVQCEAHGLNLEFHHANNSIGNLANLHIILSLPNCEYHEHIVPEKWHQFGLAGDIQVDAEGYVHAPTGPGLGFEIDWDLLRSLKPRVIR